MLLSLLMACGPAGIEVGSDSDGSLCVWVTSDRNGMIQVNGLPEALVAANVPVEVCVEPGDAISVLAWPGAE